MTPDAPERIDLRSIIRTLRTGWWLIVASMCFLGGLALALSLSQTKEYSATSSLLFRDPAFDQKLFGSTFLGGSVDPDRRAATNVALVGLRKVAARTAARPEIALTEDEVHESVAIAADGQSDVVTITATNTVPAVAAAIANAFARDFIDLRRETDQRTILAAQRSVEGQIEKLKAEDQLGRAREASLRDRAEQLYVLGSLQTGNAELAQNAEVPDEPSSPKPVRNTIFALFLGGLIGIGLAYVRSRLDRRIRTVEGLEETFGHPVLARVPVARELVIGIPEHRTRSREVFSTLWTNLRYFNVTRTIDSVLVTSPTSGDGKSTVALNLAAAAARGGSRVLLVESDLRRPSLKAVTSGSSAGGLTQVLAGTLAIDDAIVSIRASGLGPALADDKELDVMYAGATPPNPAEMLDSEPMRRLLEDLRRRYDLVVIDTPPVTFVPDAVPLLKQVSAVLVVVRIDKTNRDDAIGLRSQLAIMEAPLVGVVANYTAEAGSDYNYNYYGATRSGRPVDPDPVGVETAR